MNMGIATMAAGVALGALLGFVAAFLWMRGKLAAASSALRGQLEAESAVLRERLDARDREAAERSDTLQQLRAELDNKRGALETLRSEHAALEQRLSSIDELQARLTQTQQAHEQVRDQREALAATVAELETRLTEERKAAQEKLALLQQAREELSTQFKNLASEILEDKSKRFTEQNQSNIDGLLKPLREQLKDFEKRVGDTYDKESKDRVALHNEIRILKELNQRISDDATNLTRALKGESKTQGTWGELVLERVLELSGLSKGREYDVQVSLTDGAGKRWQPDVIVHLPEGRDMVVDSKVSLTAYERFCASDEPEARQTAIREHALSLRTHVKGLAVRDYQRLEGIRTLDYVMMFVPVEAAFADAVRHDLTLFDDALKQNILIVTPTTLLATLRAVENIWRYEDQSRNAQEIASRAGKLYDKFVGFVTDLEKVGARLRQAQDSYTDAHNKLSTGSGNLVRQAEQLKALGVSPGKKLDDELVARSGADAAGQLLLAGADG